VGKEYSMSEKQLKALCAERSAHKEAARAIVARAAAEGRDLTAAESAEFNAKMALVERAEKQYTTIDASMEVLATADAWEAGRPIGTGLPELDRRHAERRAAEAGNGTVRSGGGPIVGAMPRTFDAMFGHTPNANAGWNSPNEFLRVIGDRMHDPRLTPSAAMGSGTGSDGGHAVPTEYAKRWLDTALESEIVRPRCQLWPMQSDTLRIPAWEDDDNTSGNLFGGFSHQWLAENSAATDSQPKVRQVVLSAKKLALFTKASNELAADGINFNAQIESAMVRAAAFSLDNAFINGTGAGCPLGVLAANSLVTVAKESGQANDTLEYENITKMFSRMAPGCIGNSVWLAHPSTIPQLLELSVVIGTSGQHMAVQTGRNGEFLLLTRPVIFTEKCQPLGTKGDILLVDFSQYAVGLRREMVVQTSQHVGWQSDQIGYRCILRVDGVPLWASAHTPANGSDTLSWAVALADR
jgi:HK97 family phage major capsid protein